MAHNIMKNKKLMTINDFTNTLEVDCAHLPETAKADLEWFRKNPDCNYHIREPFTDEFHTNEIPEPDRWLTLACLIIDQDPVMYVSNNGGITGCAAHFINMGHVPVPYSAKNSNLLDLLVNIQTTPKSQAILAFLWANSLEQMGVFQKEGSAQ